MFRQSSVISPPVGAVVRDPAEQRPLVGSGPRASGSSGAAARPAATLQSVRTRRGETGPRGLRAQVGRRTLAVIELSLPEQELMRGARREARQLGYALSLDLDDSGGLVVAMVAPVSPGQATLARFLASGQDVRSTLELAIVRLHAIVERGQPWPARPA